MVLGETPGAGTEALETAAALRGGSRGEAPLPCGAVVPLLLTLWGKHGLARGARRQCIGQGSMPGGREGRCCDLTAAWLDGKRSEILELAACKWGFVSEFGLAHVRHYRGERRRSGRGAGVCKGWRREKEGGGWW